MKAWNDSWRYCQLKATLGLFSLESGEEGAFLESFFAKNDQKPLKNLLSGESSSKENFKLTIPFIAPR
jgi:hypothetical protein